jgi:hypothetical protein
MAGLDRRAVAGCGVGCLVLLVLLFALVTAFAIRGSSLLGWAFSLSQEVLSEAAPADWSEQDQATLAAAFDRAADTLARGDADVEAVDAMQTTLLDCLGRASRDELRRQDLELLRTRLEALAGEHGESKAA